MQALIIGTGSIGQRHIRNIQKLDPETRFVFLRNEAREDELSASLDATVVGSIEDALRVKPDFSVVATPSALHAEVLAPLVAAHCPTYIEKPVVTRQKDVEIVRSAIKNAQYEKPTLVGCNLRFLPALKKMKSYLQDGVLGTVVRAGLTAGQWLPDWRPNRDYRKSYSSHRELGGGVVFDLIHELDLARWFFGEFERVGSITGSFSSLEVDTEDTAAIVMAKNEGPPAITIQLDYVSRQPVRRYEFVGENGSLIFDLLANTLTWVKPDNVSIVDCGKSGFDVSQTYEIAMREFLEAVKTGEPTSQDILDGLNSVELAILAHNRAIA